MSLQTLGEIVPTFRREGDDQDAESFTESLLSIAVTESFGKKGLMGLGAAIQLQIEFHRADF
ncbi:MAG: hypothetical protein AAF394_08140 [Planctomycetota bacterium]